jgi:quercetin dioxygenase-like cupin family protein
MFRVKHAGGRCRATDRSIRSREPDRNAASEPAIQFAMIYWHLYTFPSRAAADRAKSPSGIVVEENGRVWLSEFGSRNRPLHGGHRIAVVGPLKLLPADSYTAEIAYSVMQPGDRSRAHTHSGPEAWYVLSGAQCLKTPSGTRSAGAGATMSVMPNRPMELSVIGPEVARSLTLVIHDSTQEFGTASTWNPTDECPRRPQELLELPPKQTLTDVLYQASP